MSNTHHGYYTGPERRLSTQPRRTRLDRRHRLRIESIICDCRSGHCRRREDEDGFIEVSTLYDDNLHLDED